MQPHSQSDEIERLKAENHELRTKYTESIKYIRSKVNQLLDVMGTAPLRPDELDDATLIEYDPIGIVSDSFVHILKHLHKTNDKLRFANTEIQAIFDSAGMGILVIDRDLHITSFNKKIKETFFPEKDEVIGVQCSSLICKNCDDLSKCPFKEIFSTGECVRQIQWAIGEGFFDVVGTPLINATGEITNIVIVYMDVTDKILAERALRKSEERYRDLFENANDLIQIIGPDGSILYVNAAWKQTLGYADEDIEDLSIFDIVHPDCRTCGPDFKSIICGDRHGRIETIFITKDRRSIMVEGNVNMIMENGTFAGTRGIFRDITERKETEDALAAERERLSITLRSIGDGVITTDTHGAVMLINRMAEQVTGWMATEARERPITNVFNLANEKTGKSLEEPIKEVLSTGSIIDLEKQSYVVARDGTRRSITCSIAPILNKESKVSGTVVVFRDITEKQRLEERLRRSERIESLGVLAGGIAHDFNNLLNAIMGNIDIAASSLKTGSAESDALDRAQNATLRARDLTGQLLTFSKGGAPIKKPGPLAGLIKDSSEFTIRGSQIKCSFSLPKDLWSAEFDEGQISQVISNLELNAIQAMPDGGELFISARNVSIGQDEHAQLKAGKYIKVTIRDTGTGIPPEVMPRIFEPYYTTKAKGNGLGLATAYSIIKHHDGTIDVESKSQKGTAFHLYIPAFFGKINAPEPVKDKKPIMTTKKDRGKILVMDDDNLVRATAAAMLKSLGYESAEAEDGEQAIALYAKSLEEGAKFNALIMDLTIPGGLGGKETVLRILEMDPDAKGIVSSGYSSDPIMANYKDYGFSGILAKPFRLKELNTVLSETLED